MKKYRDVRDCPKCGERGHVYNTNRNKDDLVTRWRLCRNCRWTWKTAEIDYEDLREEK